MNSVHTQEISPQSAAPTAARLAYSKAELASSLGLSEITIWRLERKGLLRAVPGVRHKIYSVAAVQRFLDGRGTA